MYLSFTVLGIKAIKLFSSSTQLNFYPAHMLDHPITVVLNVFDTLKNNGLKVYKFMSIQTQEDHISHIKQSKSDRFQDR